MDPLDHLFALSEAYAAHTGRAEGTFSAWALGGGNRLRDLRAGTSDIGVRRLNIAILWFAGNWPVGAAWPDGVPRPAAVAVASRPSTAAA